MGIQVKVQEDFFLYVPVVQDPGRSTAVTKGEQEDLPPGSDTWLRIPLAGEVVVYAHLLGDDDQIAYN